MEKIKFQLVTPYREVDSEFIKVTSDGDRYDYCWLLPFDKAHGLQIKITIVDSEQYNVHVKLWTENELVMSHFYYGFDWGEIDIIELIDDAVRASFSGIYLEPIHEFRITK